MKNLNEKETRKNGKHNEKTNQIIINYHGEALRKAMQIKLNTLMEAVTGAALEANYEQLHKMDLELAGARAVVRNRMAEIVYPELRNTKKEEEVTPQATYKKTGWTIINGERVEMEME